jgi:hypothetical protein
MGTLSLDFCEVPTPFLLRSDNGLVFSSRSYTALIKSYGLPQEFITHSNPEQNRMREQVLRALKDQCVCIDPVNSCTGVIFERKHL